MAEILQLAQLAEADHVAEVDVGPAGVEAHLEAKRPAALQHGRELILGDDAADAPLDDGGQVIGNLYSTGHAANLAVIPAGYAPSSRSCSSSMLRALSTSRFIWVMRASMPSKVSWPRSRDTNSRRRFSS